MKEERERTPVTVGGEALIEGIMMRGPVGAAVAVRLPSGALESYRKRTRTPKEVWKGFGLPLLRGPASFIYSMVFGYQCLMESAQKVTEAALEQEEEEPSGKLDQWLERHLSSKSLSAFTAAVTVIGVIVALGLFVWLPEWLTGWIRAHVQADLTRVLALISGLIRVALFVGYMFFVSLTKDIRRTFQYHGAEHKSIFCHERGLPLTIENVRAQCRFHPRCGTSFLFVMIFLGIVCSSILFAIFPQLTDLTWARMLVKILQFPVLMSLGFEFIQFAGRHLDHPLVRAVSAPGLLMQRITTKEPDDDMIEVAIEALQLALNSG